MDAVQDADGVTVTIDGPDGRHTERASYLIGADGHHSTVRRVMETAFEGFTWPELFLILSTPYDFEPSGYARASYIADPEEWVMLFKKPGSDAAARWRLALPADPALPNDEQGSEPAVQRRIGGFHTTGAPYEVIHRNAYRVHQRVARSYYRGRIALAGDAAHVNNPLGGMGLNGGVHDAVNLADKLARLWHGEAGAEVLARYERQRRPVQIDYVQDITIRNKRLVEERDPAVRRERQDEIRATGDDPAMAYEYLLDTSMISMIRKEATIA